MPAYIVALKKEISGLSFVLDDYRIKTIYMGGGTPTLVHEDFLREIIKLCQYKLNVSIDAEITIESNPATLNRSKLRALRETGINRLSVGFQAKQDYHLKTLGRQHTSQDFMLAIDWARAAGFENINADILLSIPGQSSKDLLETIDMAIEASVTHLSLYSLRLEEKTPLYDAMFQGEITLPEDDEDRRMFHEARELLLRHGFFRYEISNFAKGGMECAHNLMYWHNNEYVGCGSNAHSYFSNARYANHTDVRAYIESVDDPGGQTREFTVIVDTEEERFDTLMLGLRLVNGINKAEFVKRFGHDINFFYKKQIDDLKTQGLLLEDESKLYCTQKGLDLQNYVLLGFTD
jgi:oxygen-independent coproporphyrinogen-3 oxidase